MINIDINLTILMDNDGFLSEPVPRRGTVDEEFYAAWSLLRVRFINEEIQQRYVRNHTNALNVILSSFMLFGCAPIWAIHCPRLWDINLEPLYIFASYVFYTLYCLPLVCFLLIEARYDRNVTNKVANDLSIDEQGSNHTDLSLDNSSLGGSSLNNSSTPDHTQSIIGLRVSRIENYLRNLIPIGGALTCSSLMLARCISNVHCTSQDLEFFNTFRCNPNPGTIPADTTFVCLVVPLFMHQMLKLDFLMAFFLWGICYGSVVISTIYLQDINVSFWTTLCGGSLLLLIVEGETTAAFKFFVRMREAKQTKLIAEKVKLLAISRARNKLVRRVSHEMRSPMFVMASSLDFTMNICESRLAKAEKVQPEFVEALREIKQMTEFCSESRRIAVETLDELLLVDKLQTNNLILCPKRVDFMGFLGPSLRYFQQSVCNSKSLNFLIDDQLTCKSSSSVVWVVIDESRMRQVFLNLITNSIKFTQPHGTITFRIMLVKREASHGVGSSVVIEIADNGVGVEPKHIPNMFSEGYQINPERTQSGGGSGYGLFICKEIVRMHQACEIWVESAGAGLGTSFFVRIPVAGDDINQQSETNSASVAASLLSPELQKAFAPIDVASGLMIPLITPDENVKIVTKLSEANYAILIVDDVPLVRKMLRKMLVSVAPTLDIVDAIDGLDAVEKFESSKDKFRGIIMDNQMPRMNGIESIMELRKRGCQCWILGATGNSTHQDFHEAGVRCVLKKPFTKEELCTAILLEIEQANAPAVEQSDSDAPIADAFADNDSTTKALK